MIGKSSGFDTKGKFLLSYKAFFGLLGFSAIVTEVATLVDQGVLVPANFFSYFTIESNILAFSTLLLSALVNSHGRNNRSLEMLRGASTLYMVITGIIFAVLLSGLENTQFTAVPWDNIVLHYIIPVAIFVDWVR